MAERHGGRSGSRDARGGTRRDQEIEKRLENHKRLIDFNKTLNNLYAESADYQRDIQRQMGVQETQMRKSGATYERLRDISKEHSEMVSRAGKFQGTFNRLTRRNTTTAKMTQVLMHATHLKDLDRYDTMKKQHDIGEKALETAYEDIGLLGKRTSLEESLMKAQDYYVENYKDMTEDEKELYELQMKRMRTAIRMQSIQTAINETLGEQTTQFRNLIKSAMVFATNPLTMILGLVGATINSVFEVEAGLFAGAQAAGALSGQMQSTSDELEKSKDSLQLAGVSFEYANQVAGELAKTQGMIGKDGAAFAAAVSPIANTLGLGAAEAAKLASSMKNTLGFTADTAEQQLDSIMKDAAAAGVPLSAVLDEISNSTDTTAGLFAKNPQQLAKASIEARGLGLTLSQITKNLDNITDLQGTFNKQAELSSVLGRRVNLLQVNGLLFQGKTTDAVKAYNSQVFKSVEGQARIDEFNEMNVIKQKMVADGVGLTVKEFQKALRVQADQANMTEAEIDRINRQQKLSDQLKNRALTGLEKITRIFRPVFNQIFESLLDVMDSIDFNSIASSLSEFFSDDNIKGFIDKLVSGFKQAKDFAGKIVGFVSENPKLAGGLLAGFFALKKGIGLLTGGSFGPIAKVLPMALKALPAIGGIAGVIAAGFMAVQNLSTLFGGRDKADRIEKTKALSSSAGMVVGAGIGAIFGPIGMAIGAALGGFIGGTDFGQKLFRGIFPESTITKLISMFDNLKDAGNKLFEVFASTEGEGLGQRIGKALRAAFDEIDWLSLLGTGATLIEDVLIFLTDVVGGIFGVEGLGKTVSDALRSGLDFIVAYVKSIPDKFKILGMKLSLAIDRMLRIKSLGIGKSDAELAKQEAEIATAEMQMQQKFLKNITTDRAVGAKVDDAIIKPSGEIIRFNPNDTAVLTKEGIAPDMSETNELLRQLIQQQGGTPIQLNIDGQKVGQAIANSRYRN